MLDIVNLTDDLYLAVKCEDTNGVLRLLVNPMVGPNYNDSSALCLATRLGNVEIFDLLLPYSDPIVSDVSLSALNIACFREDDYMVNRIVDFVGYTKAADWLRQNIDEEQDSHWATSLHIDGPAWLARLEKRELSKSTVDVPKSLQECVDEARDDLEQQVHVRATVRRL
ncbi:ankyrin repeat domain-containing protein [Xanthomonas cannabis]|uniref:ankyrin repeat domain-containing protein n=1 Tax=Xanthomonas cannabis TaxID=1885674 RepID=UPI0011126328|nr:ankyrin repeat domain-containing protein [Xanthomonas cannabis]